MATLHLMVGLPCAGKTTMAGQLERNLPALRLNLDEVHIQLYGQDAEDPEHDSRHVLIESMLWKIGRRALELGSDVILDYGFWARDEREDYRAQAKIIGAASELHFLDVPEDQLLSRLRQRNMEVSEKSFFIPEESMGPWMQQFERPDAEELMRRE